MVWFSSKNKKLWVSEQVCSRSQIAADKFILTVTMTTDRQAEFLHGNLNVKQLSRHNTQIHPKPTTGIRVLIPVLKIR
jgi:hypothetical protein